MSEIKFCSFGLTESERKMLNGVVMISKRRTPVLTLLDNTDFAKANILIIDGKSPAATQWAALNGNLINKNVVWIDANSVSPNHTSMNRPVQWAQLPIILARQVAQNDESNAQVKSTDNLANSSLNLANTTSTLSQSSNNSNFENNLNLIRQNSENYLKKRQAINGNTPSSLPQSGLPYQTQSIVPKKPHILVVDDSQVVRDHLTNILHQQGYEVTTVENGSDALGSFDPDKYQAVLMDVLMPEMDGYEACRRLKAAIKGRSNVPVIMLTSKSSPFDRIRGKMAGCNAYLTKPVALSDLIKVLNSNIS